MALYKKITQLLKDGKVLYWINKRWRVFRKRKASALGLPAIPEKVIRQPVVVDLPERDPNKAPAVSDQNFPYQLMAAVIIKNEAPYMVEWLEFHRLAGIQKIIIYDNGSSDNIQALLKPFILEGYVELIPWPNFLSQYNHQHLCYAHVVRYTAQMTKWLAIIDADEFLFSPTGRPLPQILQQYSDIPILGAAMRTFGFSGHEKKPQGLVTENFLYRFADHEPESNQYRSIVQPRLVRSIISAARYHHLLNNVPAYDEDRNPLHNWPTEKPLNSLQLRVNHYLTKSREEFMQKISRQYFVPLERYRERYKKKYKTQAQKDQSAADWAKWMQASKMKMHQKIFNTPLENFVLDKEILMYQQKLQEAIRQRLSPVANI